MRFLGHPSLRAVGCPSQRPDETSGPPQWANRKLFEALRPSFCDLVSEHADGSKTSYHRARRGYAKMSHFRDCYGLAAQAGLMSGTSQRIVVTQHDLEHRLANVFDDVFRWGGPSRFATQNCANTLYYGVRVDTA